MNQDPLTTDPPPPAPPPPEPRRLRRRVDSPLGGVGSGIADYLGIDPVIVRIAFVVLSVAANGVGILVYLAAWILLPDQTNRDPQPIALNSSIPAIVFGGIVLVGAASAVFGTIRLGFDASVVIPLALIAGGVFLLNQRSTVAGTTDHTTYGPGPVANPVSDPSPSSTAGAPPPSPTSAFVAGAPSSEPTHWATPVVDSHLEPPTPTPPKPPVTSVTLAVGAVVVAILLAVSQLTSAEIGATAVFGAFAAACGAGLVASAFLGRARPLIPIGLLALVGLGLAPIAETTLGGGVGPRDYTIFNDADLEATYEVGSGYIDLDMRRLELVEDREITVDVGAGYVEIVVPADANVIVEAGSRFGYVDVFGEEESGVSTSINRTRNQQEGAPTLRINADVTFGYVEVRRG